MFKYENNALIKAIKDDELRKRTLSLVEKILARSHMIWGFIRYPEMADHCERHTGNVFELLTRFLVYSQKHLLEGENKLNDSELFCLILATWLHDIGGMGGGINDKEFLSPGRARKEHPFNGGRLVLNDGTLFLDLANDEQSAIADIVVSHSSRVELKQLQPKMVGSNSVRTELLAVLLSLADACDTQERRVGGFEEVRNKLDKLEKLKKKLEEDIKRIESKQSSDKLILEELRADIEYIGAQPGHHHKHLSVKNVFFTPTSIILEKNILMLPEYDKYFDMALSDVQKELGRIRGLFSKYGIILREVRAFDENKNSLRALYTQVEQYEHRGLSEEEGRRIRTKIFEYIDFFENYSRTLITKELKSYYTKNWYVENYKKIHNGEEPRKIPKVIWWEQGVPKDVSEYCEKKRKEELGEGKSEEPLILNYADFSHYPKIILRRDNWRNIFSSCFKGKEDSDIRSGFNKLKKFRDPSHHHRTVSNEVEWVRLWIRNLCVDEEAKREFDNLVEEWEKKKPPIQPPTKPSQPKFPEIEYDKSVLYEVTTSGELYELIENTEEDYFLEKPFRFKEWKSKRDNLFYFGEESTIKDEITDMLAIQARQKILPITGPPNVGKTTFLLFFLDECLRRNLVNWEVIFFLNPDAGKLEEALDQIDGLAKRFGAGKVLFVIDALKRIQDEDKEYIEKSKDLFEKLYGSQYKLIFTVRDEEEKSLRKELDLKWFKYGIEKEKKLEPDENFKRIKRILVRSLEYHKVDLQGLSFDDPTFNDYVRIISKNSRGSAGYIAALIEHISMEYGLLSADVIEKSPEGMTNLFLDIFLKSFYQKNDKVFPLLIIILTKLRVSVTKYFFDSFIVWGIKEKLMVEGEERISARVNNLTDFYTIARTFEGEEEYRLLDYWKEGIYNIVNGKEEYNEKYEVIVSEFKEAERKWELLIKKNYLFSMYEDLETRSGLFSPIHSDAWYLVA